MRNKIKIGQTLLFIFLLCGCRRTDSPVLKLSGTLELTEHSVGAQVSGRLVSLRVDEGDFVKQGQLLGTLDRFEQAKKDYERVEALYKEGGADAQQAEHALLAMKDQQMLSPLDGVILLKVHETGEMVPAGSAVVVIGDTKNPWVRVYVPEGIINKVRMNMPATLRFDGLDNALKGHVSFIATKAEFTPRNVQTPEERVTQTFAVKVALDEPGVLVHPGVSADVTLQLGEPSRG